MIDLIKAIREASIQDFVLWMVELDKANRKEEEDGEQE